MRPAEAKLSELAEQLAATAVLLDPNDLTTLADLHTRFEAIGEFSREIPEAARAAMAGVWDAAAGAAQTLEKIILREVDDATSALDRVQQTVRDLQGFAQGHEVPAAEPTAPAPAVAAAPVAAPVAAPAEAHAAPKIEAESVVNPDDLPLVAEFVSEANGHMEAAEGGLLALEEDPSNFEKVAAVFRSFHTIKGVAGFLNLKQIGSLAHAAENLLDLARHGQIQLVGDRLDLVLSALDAMKGLVADLDAASKEGRAPARVATLPALLDRLHACAANPQSAEQREPSSSAAGQPAETESAPVQEDRPAAEPLGSRAPSTKSASAQTTEQTVKVATDRLDSLINMVGELVIAQSMVAQDIAGHLNQNQRLSRNMGHLGKITRELQDLSMSMRMVPIHGVFQKMARLVRDVARKFGKEIDFHLVGGETELDRNVVEAISDPLVHMVRNSVDHGVEMPDDRERSGKSRAGRVELRAYHQAGSIVIEITDDGRGLNKARLLKKAREAGLIKEGQELTEQEIFKLIFHPGLSTAEKVTDVSGRGVGMDVVKKNVESLRGRIDITSVEGKGSTFTIRLPLTLAVIDGLVVRVGAERYIIPLTSVEQSIRPKAEHLSTLQGRGEMCLIRDRLLPLFRLHRLFNVQAKHEDPTEALVVIVQDEDRHCCLLVDELLGQQQVVIKSLGEGLGQVQGISGGAILGDGNISLILDVPGLIAMAAQ